MKHILYIAPHDLNKRTGGALATLAYFNALVKLYGDKVDIMMPKEYDDGSFRNVIPVKSRSHIRAIISGCLHRYKVAVKQFLLKYANNYEACIINGGLYAGDMMDMIHSFGLLVMVIHHNFEREYAIDNKGLLTLGGCTSFFIVRNEKKAYQNADVNCFLTIEDINLFQEYYGQSSGKNYLLGVFEPREDDFPYNNHGASKAIVITGSMNSVQTMCGITDIHKNYYDIIREICPEWDLIIAGRDPRSQVYELQKENPDKIKVLPNPTSMDEITAQATMFLCPTNVGGGLKLRVMDGLRMGLPVLVHKVSARGYDSFVGKPYFKVYYDRVSFACGLRELKDYCANNNPSVIQLDYYNSFSFNTGCSRMKRAMDLLLQKNN